MKYTIRKCKEGDLEDLVRLCHNHATYEHVSYSTKDKAEKLKQAIFSETPVLYCWIIDFNGVVGGYFSYTFDYSTWDACRFLHLDCLYLEPEYRGNGIGKDIFEKLKSIAAENHCVNIQWQTPDFNQRAIEFYKKIGATGKNKVRFFIDVSSVV